MIIINNAVKKHQKNFWNNCLFHPTDAVEDAWGKRILDRMAEDKSIHSVRIYTMFEDIVLMDENGKLTYDFRINDLRLDYLTGQGYNILLAYGMMPECIATDKNAQICESKNKTRYKGKLINTSLPTDFKLWEEVCYEYTRHIIDRYGIETVSKWHLQCWNEPDGGFFMSKLPVEESVDIKLKEYCKLYKAFADGVTRASEKVCIGGPTISHRERFLEGFLNYIRENNVRLDYISAHNYAMTGPTTLNRDNRGFSVNHWLELQQKYMDVIEKCGFSDTELVIDEWGMAALGFFNVEECPDLMARETEVFSSYYVKLIHQIIEKGWNMSKLMICLSGQHEMVTDFSGFRNFFTLNFIAKPIYNAYVLASKLHKSLLDVEKKNKNIFVIPTKNEQGDYSVLLTYSGEKFEENLPETTEELTFEDDISGKKVTVYCIDKNTTNPYRLYQKMGIAEIGEKEIELLREEGNLKPVAEFDANEKISLKLTANCVYLVEVK